MSYKIIIYENPLSAHFRKKKISKYVSKFFFVLIEIFDDEPKAQVTI